MADDDEIDGEIVHVKSTAGDLATVPKPKTSFFGSLVRNHRHRIDARIRKTTEDVLTDEVKARTKRMKAGAKYNKALFDVNQSEGHLGHVGDHLELEKAQLDLAKKQLEIEAAKLDKQMADLQKKETPQDKPQRPRKAASFQDYYEKRTGSDSDAEGFRAEEERRIDNSSLTDDAKEHKKALLRAAADEYVQR